MKPPTDEQIEQAQREAEPLPWTFWAAWVIVVLASLSASILIGPGLQVLP
jgi:hypothetical protein